VGWYKWRSPATVNDPLVELIVFPVVESFVVFETLVIPEKVPVVADNVPPIRLPANDVPVTAPVNVPVVPAIVPPIRFPEKDVPVTVLENVPVVAVSVPPIKFPVNDVPLTAPVNVPVVPETVPPVRLPEKDVPLTAPENVPVLADKAPVVSAANVGELVLWTFWLSAPRYAHCALEMFVELIFANCANSLGVTPWIVPAADMFRA